MVTSMPSIAAPASGIRRATNVTIDSALLDEAKRLRINVSQAASAGLTEAIAERRRQQWLEENRAALLSSNAYVEAYGLPLSQFRNF